MKALSAFQQLRATAQQHGLPKAFQTDLTVHDQAYLRRRKRPTCFGWLLREHGTDILLNTLWSRVLIEYHQRDPQVLWFWFDGTQLRPASPAELLQLLEAEPEVTRHSFPTLFPEVPDAAAAS